MKNTLAIVLTAALGWSCGGGQAQPETPAPADPHAQTVAAGYTVATEKLSAESVPENLFMKVEVEGHGTILIEFYTQDAPLNVTNVANLAIEGFYDGLTFHRIIPGFVVQGGDPEGTGAGGLGYTVPAEISKLHEKGCVAMARKPDEVNPDRESSSCQFYFCLEALEKLDGGYTVIGKIIEGLDVMEKLGQVETNENDRPTHMLVMDKVTVLTK
ncbi:MAG: peptidylprolyl isomerase [Deltaproteobacteria bacterium]|nr:peptidylprolyl isomerase [Deltaproteobacteria bacterium]